MQCLFVADLHYSLPQFDWLLQAAKRYDLVVFAGHALDLGSIVDFRAQTLVVRKYLERLAGATRLIVCSGNHDLDTRGDTGEKVARWIEDLRALNILIDGDSVVVDDTLFTICPWWTDQWSASGWLRSSKGMPDAAKACAGSGSTSATTRFPDQLVGEQIARGLRSSAVDRPAQPRHRNRGPCAPVAFCEGWLVGRPDRNDVGFQRRPPVRGTARPHRARYEYQRSRLDFSHGRANGKA